MNPSWLGFLKTPQGWLALLLGTVALAYLNQLGVWLFKKTEPWLELKLHVPILWIEWPRRLFVYLLQLSFFLFLFSFLSSVNQSPTVISKRLLPIEKAILAQACQSKNGGIPFDPAAIHKGWKKLEDLPQGSRDDEILDAIRSLQRQGLIEVIDLRPNDKGGTTRDFRITPLGERVTLSIPKN